MAIRLFLQFFNDFNGFQLIWSGHFSGLYCCWCQSSFWGKSTFYPFPVAPLYWIWATPQEFSCFEKRIRLFSSYKNTPQKKFSRGWKKSKVMLCLFQIHWDPIGFFCEKKMENCQSIIGLSHETRGGHPQSITLRPTSVELRHDSKLAPNTKKSLPNGSLFTPLKWIRFRTLNL